MKHLFYSVLFFYLITLPCVSSCSFKKRALWIQQVEDELKRHTQTFNGDFGVYIKDLETQEDFSLNGSQSWYLSSTVKIPVALTLLQQVDQKKLRLEEKVTIQKTDYRDGAGSINWVKPGKQVTYKNLLKQMLVYSDNAATDIIIRKVGLNNINKLVADYTDSNQFGNITTLLDVRKIAYANFHPQAKELSNLAFFEIKKQKSSKKKINELSKQLNISKEKFATQNLDSGFEKYYTTGLNSASLLGYAQLLEKLITEKILSPSSTKMMLDILSKLHTGKKRITYGLPKNTFFAHKTGTQHKRACDVGVAGDKKSNKPKVLILVCTAKWKKLSHAEKLMADVGRIISKTNLLK